MVGGIGFSPSGRSIAEADYDQAGTFTAKQTFADIEIDGALDHDGATVGFYGSVPVARAGATAELKASLAALGLITDGGATPLNLDGGDLTGGIVNGTALQVSGVALASTHLSDSASIPRTANSNTWALKQTFSGEIEIDGDLNHDGASVGFYGVTPVARPAAYTQNGVASRTIPADSSSALSTSAATSVTPWGFSSQVQADNIATQFNLLRTLVFNIRNAVLQIQTDLKSQGLLQ